MINLTPSATPHIHHAGVAGEYDVDKGKFIVDLPRGRRVAFRPVNLLWPEEAATFRLKSEAGREESDSEGEESEAEAGRFENQGSTLPQRGTRGHRASNRRVAMLPPRNANTP